MSSRRYAPVAEVAARELAEQARDEWNPESGAKTLAVAPRSRCRAQLNGRIFDGHASTVDARSQAKSISMHVLASTVGCGHAAADDGVSAE